jgi:hypothetical protein
MNSREDYWCRLAAPGIKRRACGSPRKAGTTWPDGLIMIRRFVRRTLTLLLFVVLAFGVLRTNTGLQEKEGAIHTPKLDPSA